MQGTSPLSQPVPQPLAQPLVVDLDGTLLRSDMLIETAFAHGFTGIRAFISLIAALMHGKAQLKHHLAQSTDFDPARLPYDDAVLARIRCAASEGRPVYLASASDRIVVGKIAAHLGLFAGVFASDGVTNAAGDAKAEKLTAAFGEGGFDYIGNDAADLPVWRRARRAFAIRLPRASEAKLRAMKPDAETIPTTRAGWRDWLRLLRVHQYSKNALVFLPLLTAQKFTGTAIAEAVLAAVAFSLCASSVYIVNDCADVAADRDHPVKRSRPLASGLIAPKDGLLAAALLLVCAFAAAFLVSGAFAAALLGYFGLTTAYTFWLKRKVMVDIVVLAMLYTSRVICGAIAIGVVVSEWLLAFSMLLFTSLALVKRYTELAMRDEAGTGSPANRNYRLADLGVVEALAAASAVNAVTVFSLYISSDTVRRLYSHPQVLWLICPLLMYWIGRVLILAHRREMNDDPIVFAIGDKVSLAVVVLSVAIVLIAI